jgi:hypothetical protein
MSFSVFSVNVWAVLVAGIAYFVIGAAWYGSSSHFGQFVRIRAGWHGRPD